MKVKILTVVLLLPIVICAQSDIATVLRVGEVVLSGFTIFKSAKSDTDKNGRIVSSVCIKNRLTEKITFKMSGKDEQDNDVKKEMVVQNDGKECVFNIPKGVYNYEVTLSNKDVYKKGEYKFDDDVVITIKKEE
jgi:hypothetical protein